MHPVPPSAEDARQVISDSRLVRPLLLRFLSVGRAGLMLIRGRLLPANPLQILVCWSFVTVAVFSLVGVTQGPKKTVRLMPPFRQQAFQELIT